MFWLPDMETFLMRLRYENLVEKVFVFEVICRSILKIPIGNLAVKNHVILL